MSEKLSEFLAEHRASEFGLAPVSKALAIKMAVAIETKLEALNEITDVVSGWAEIDPTYLDGFMVDWRGWLANAQSTQKVQPE